jgi:acetyl esterase/lipase
MAIATAEITTEEHEYLRHADRGLTLRLFRPPGDGPFPVVINLHGGCWTNGDLDECRPRDEAITNAGVASAALDFRHAGDGYPSSLVDINYAVRWVKSRAADLRLDAQRVALAGQSSGGHLAMLAAMRPHDPRYAAIKVDGPEVDASVRCVAMTWPVINPLSRYRHAHRLRNGENPPAWTADIPERHDLYWRSEANMEEGNPLLALERGEQVLTPPAIWVQGQPDEVHDYRDPQSKLDLNEPERFAQRYKEAGGTCEVVYTPFDTRAVGSLDPISRFLADQLL